MGRHDLSRAEAIMARAGRSAEDPREMTEVARMAWLLRFVADAYAENPDRPRKEIVAAAKLKMRAHMAALGRKSAAARRQASGRGPAPLDEPDDLDAA